MNEHLNAQKLLEEAKLNLASDYSALMRLVESPTSGAVSRFVLLAMEWRADSTKRQCFWEMFHTAFDCESPLSFFGELYCFVGNCLLDDSAFAVEWRKPDYRMETVDYGPLGVREVPELQWLPGGGFKTKLTTKDDPDGRPNVIWAHDDTPGRSIDVHDLFEAMKIKLEREEERLKHFEEVQNSVKTMMKVSEQAKKEEVPWLACCPLAVATPCVCVAAYDCPTHGPRHVGSHD